MRLRSSPVAALDRWIASAGDKTTGDFDSESGPESPKSLLDGNLRKFTRLIELGMVVSSTVPPSILRGRFVLEFVSCPLRRGHRFV